MEARCFITLTCLKLQMKKCAIASVRVERDFVDFVRGCFLGFVRGCFLGVVVVAMTRPYPPTGRCTPVPEVLS